MEQPSLLSAGPTAPEGFLYRTDFLSPDEEAALVGRLERLPLAPFEFGSYEGKRRVLSFGWRYSFKNHALARAEPMPEFLLGVRDRAAFFAGIAPEAFEHVLLTDYPPGAPIGWHRDRPVFERVVGISLVVPCRLRFRRKRGATWERLAVPLAPRSAYLLSGPAREEWEHSIAPLPERRLSITFRNLREAHRG